jgi:acetyl esterase/lipase
MTEQSKPTGGVDRRRLLAGAAGGAALTTLAAGEAQAGVPAPMTPEMYVDRLAKVERIPLWPGQPPGGPFRARPRPAWAKAPDLMSDIETPALHVFRSPRPSGQGLLVIPGGAYAIVSIGNEGVDVADRLNPAGVTVFVLTYRLPGEGWSPRQDAPLQDAQRAMRLIRSRAGEFAVDPNRLTSIGFSAGGHLNASLTTDYESRVYAPVDAADQLSAKPFASALIYPVIAMEPPYAHMGSRDLLLGPDPSPELVARRSPVQHIGPDTPPIFLAHALDDEEVPPENSLMVMNAMRAARRPVEAHFFQEGRHAFGIGRPGTPSAQWPDLFLAWLAWLERA